MSLEQQPAGSNPEQQRKLEAIKDAADKLRNVHEKELTTAEKSHGDKEQVEQLRSSAEKHAPLASELSNTEKNHAPKAHPMLINKQLKDMAYSRALTRVQKRLSAPGRVFSKLVHSAALDRPSEAIGKTVARPSGMLGGAFSALIGTSILLWVTRHYGYEYNYLAVILLFVCGMAFGLAAEGIFKAIKRSRS
jgi:hypothetical protein